MLSPLNPHPYIYKGHYDFKFESIRNKVNDYINHADRYTKLDVAIDVILKPGDIIYIPARCYHQAQPQDKRLSLSIPMQHLVNLKKVDRKYYAIPT